MVKGKLQLVEAPEQTPVKIKAGETYRSFDGRKIQVWAINKNSEDFPVVGCIDYEGEWRPMVWNTEGITKRPFGRINDIVAPWSET